MSGVVRVLVVAASVQRQHHLRALLDSAPPLHVIGTAGTADEAIGVATRRNADVIVLDQGGSARETLACTRRIMQVRATPIVVVTAAAMASGAQQAFALMEAGALAAVADPGDRSGPEQREALAGLLEKIRQMAQLKVVRRWAPVPGELPPAVPAGLAKRASVDGASPVQQAALQARRADGRIELVAIGASTGGPVALKQLLAELPADFPAPIVVVQHIADGFLQGLADWLSQSCALPARIAEPGIVLQPGRIYLAPDGAHMRVEPLLRLAFDSGSVVNGHRPAVARLLGSVAAHYGSRAIGVLLTGMGKDGATELKLMRDAGSITFAQDAASSVVHGMPGEAIRCGGADYVMAPEAIGLAITGLVGGRK